MTQTDTCGAETATGGSCNLPASQSDDRCHIHTADDSVAAVGRPSKFSEDRREAAIESARQGKSKAGCARAAGVSKSTLEDWLDKHGKFRNAFARARGEGESVLVEGGLYDDEVNTRMAKFLLSTSFDYTERQELEHTGEIETGDIVVNFSDTQT